MYYLLPTFIILMLLIGSGTGMYGHDQAAVIDLIMNTIGAKPSAL